MLIQALIEFSIFLPFSVLGLAGLWKLNEIVRDDREEQKRLHGDLNRNTDA